MNSEVITSGTLHAWNKWIAITRSRCHLHFELDGGDLHSHIARGLESGRKTVSRVVDDMHGIPLAILEVGSSVGFNCLALAERFPDAEIFGIEPDGEACEVATKMAQDFGFTNVSFTQGVGESLPFSTSSLDWIVCHTVIEHVNDVDACIAEMTRVLRPQGCLHLDAPNYIFPWEPHLQIVVPPLCPKPLMRLLARLQGASANVGYADHLKLVHPAWIERCFAINRLQWVNRVESKLRLAAKGRSEHIASYGRAARCLVLLSSIGLANLAIGILLRLRLYPSILYTAYKSPDET
jgi:SAM-dependent methyltransferase